MGLKFLKTANTLLYLSEGSLTDKSGNANNATNINSTVISNNGRFGNDFSFNGTTQRLSIANPSSFKLTTITAHVVFYYVSGSTDRMLFHTSNTTSSASSIQAGINFYLTSANKLALHTTNTSGTYTITETTITPVSGWNMASFTVNTSTLAIYINGNLNTSTSCTTPVYATTNYVNVGIRYMDYATFQYIYPFNSLIDSIIVENRVWTAREIHRLYQQNFKPE